MKRLKNLYPKITDMRYIMNTYENEVRPHTKNKMKVEKFDEYRLLNLTRIQKNIIEGKLRFSGYYIFLIKEPKYRIIMSQTMVDKVINHLVARYILLEAFEPCLIDANVATRVGKGTDYGRDLLKKYIGELKKKKKEIYYLKCDIRKYFYNVDHTILKKIIRTKIKDKEALSLIDQIIDTTNSEKVSKQIDVLCETEKQKIESLSISLKEKEEKWKQIDQLPRFSKKGKGIPIGNMTSQAFAIIYLNAFDHYIKEKLHVPYYVRYMDDFVILSTNKDWLKELLGIIDHKLREEYLLELNPKTQIGMLKNGLDIMGFRFILDHGKLYLKLRTNIKRRFKKKMKHMQRACQNGKITYDKLVNVRGSYHGHLLSGNAYYLYHKVTEKYDVNIIEDLKCVKK